jgi:hypothetical protein
VNVDTHEFQALTQEVAELRRDLTATMGAMQAAFDAGRAAGQARTPAAAWAAVPPRGPRHLRAVEVGAS